MDDISHGGEIEIAGDRRRRHPGLLRAAGRPLDCQPDLIERIENAEERKAERKAALKLWVSRDTSRWLIRD